MKLTDIKIKKQKPPNFGEIIKAFPSVNWERPLAFAYGDTVYHNLEKMTEHLLIHESTHLHQQEFGKKTKEWWDKYIQDPHFRVSQEIEAYGNQYKFVKARTNARGADNFLDQCAHALSGEIYNNAISFAEARSKIRNHAKND